MKLHQLKYAVAVARNGLNITRAAERLYTSQPGISKQIRLLEDELGVEIFTRRGKSLAAITPSGREVLRRAECILQEVDNIRQFSADLRNDLRGTLSIGTTQTQSRFVLPPVLNEFRNQYPGIRIQLHQGTSEQLADLLKRGDLDFVLTSDAQDLFADTVKLPCYHWHRVVLVPKDHPLANGETLSLKSLARYPIVSYVFRSDGRSSLLDAFRSQNLDPNVAFTARDADVIKTYVREGAGVGVVAPMAIEESDGLVALDARDLLPRCTAWIGYRRGRYLRDFMRDFIHALAPHINRNLLQRVEQLTDLGSIDRLVGDVKLPERY